MSKKFSPYRNIFQVLKLNRLVSISVSIGAFCACMFSGYLVYKMHRDAVEHAFAINTRGEVIPLSWQLRRDNLKVEAMAHLELFHRYFYGLSPATYEQRLEKALWLGNSSVDNVYRQKRADGVYNRILQYALVQQIDTVESEVELDQAPYPFSTRTVFRINRGSIEDAYELITTGKLLPVERQFPQNTHGLLITDFFEKHLRKLPVQ
ncbi:conjugal transfer protein TraK [Zunongwangia sp. F363]|uniref:Conjugal transfer protein TraK n=1 Tax=Autumnicola tepida TaxID=3075595 RepID=A0ABU3C789_9FLAO|nr:conjugal transfer protein TraK [Zunongwangia sp. F363]MDT0642204.1 conjugal transfer protein TraK [Zunongwangia sp. F363]